MTFRCTTCFCFWKLIIKSYLYKTRLFHKISMKITFCCSNNVRYVIKRKFISIIIIGMKRSNRRREEDKGQIGIKSDW